MPFPIAIVFVGAGAAVAGVVGGVVSELHDNHSAHSEYSDRAQREENERKAREEQRKEDLKKAKAELNKTLRDVRAAMSGNAGEGHDVFDAWEISSKDFAFKDLTAEMGKLDGEAASKIKEATELVFDEEERGRKAELDEVNAMLRLLAEKRCGESTHE